MQVQRFPIGKGFVIHKIETDLIKNASRISAWFDEEGKPLDAEIINFKFQSRPVKKGGPIWKRLESLGQAWKTRPL